MLLVPGSVMSLQHAREDSFMGPRIGAHSGGLAHVLFSLGTLLSLAALPSEAAHQAVLISGACWGHSSLRFPHPWACPWATLIGQGQDQVLPPTLPPCAPTPRNPHGPTRSAVTGTAGTGCRAVWRRVMMWEEDS